MGPGDIEPATLQGTDAEAALAKLTPLHREVLLLRFQNDLSYEEIAMVVGISVGTVRSRLHNARANLRKLLDAGGSQPTALPTHTLTSGDGS
jgi:RNA polymerase sigma-70 factor (ECF subfamily)